MTDQQAAPMTEAMYYVLLSLKVPLHGYAIMDAVKEISGGRVRMGPGTLYGILKRMQNDNLIFLENSDGRRKIYHISSKGREALQLEYTRLSSMVRDGKSIIEEWGTK